MTSEEEQYSRVIDTLIRQGRSFAIYRIPGELPQFVMQTSGSARLLYHIEELDEQQGFVIAPFHPSAHLPIVLIEPDCTEIPRSAETDCLPEQSPLHPDASEISSGQEAKDTYLQVFDHFIRPLREKEFEKLVLSRSLTVERPACFSAAQAFYEACRRYIYSYIYLCHTPETGTWMGSTPEIILSGENGAWQTVALAGTQPFQNGALPISWDEKNREEQGFVASYVRQQLSVLGITPVEEGPYSVRAGELAHLKSDYHFSLPDNKQLGDLLKRLHPTPAVCGLPKDKACRFILENEGYNRRYYSGFIGWLNPEGRSDLYVNLRCMNILSHSLTLYAGSGLLASSSPESEWQETEAKMQTMGRLLTKKN